MNVYITNTPEFSSDKLDEVLALLQGTPGELKFDKGESFTQVQYKWLNPRFIDIEGIDSLTFKEYFDLVQGYRVMQKIKDEDFVILISTIRHEQNWFSGFNNRNIFIHGDEWDIISDVDSKFGIAYECVENILQSLMGLDIMNYKNEPNIHKESIGCINDFCDNKTDIIRKFKSGDICHSCMYVAEFDKKVSKYILSQIIQIIEEIRKEFVVSKKLRNITKLEKVKVDSEWNIFIGDKPVKMEALPKVLYISFLKHLDGVQSDKLCENQGLFQEIYKKVKKNPDPEVIERLCCKKIDPDNPKLNHKPTFETNRTRVKEALVKTLGTTLTNYYHINYVEAANHKMMFKVNLSEDDLEWKVTFTK